MTARDHCRSAHADDGIVWHCAGDLGHDGDHGTINHLVTWPELNLDDGPRWVKRVTTALVWHRVETSTLTACGKDVHGLTVKTIRGRTLRVPPAGGQVCPRCITT